jgi:putative ABC transport system permease protein
MNLFSLVWNYLKAKPLNTGLNILLSSLGIAVITVLLLFNNQLTNKIEQNARGVDLVVGAKGSPLQLILCNIFHIDFPTGNIRLDEAEKIAKNRLVKSAIPLALGDSYEGYRIIGTTRDYVNLYDAQLATGEWWKNEMEVTLGSFAAQQLMLKTGDHFESTHGLTQGGHAHDEQHFVVKGILASTGTVIDNLIFTSVESIWHVHEEHAEDERKAYRHQADSVANPSRLVPSVAEGDSTKEITSLLLEYRSPMAAIQLPRFVNSKSSLQAASPAFETARLFSILGVGVDVLMALAYVLIFISGLSIFIALYNSLKERRYDLAIMRSMGASRLKIFTAVIFEGVLITFAGVFTGLVLGHGILLMASVFLPEVQKAGVTGLVFYQQELVILAGSLILGFVCALIPAWQAYRTDISKILAGN